MTYDPDTWRVREENLRLARENRQLSETLASERIERGVKDVLGTPNIDAANMEAFIRGSNLRVDPEGRPIVDIDEKTMTLPEALSYMQSSPQHANIANVQKPREPTRQEKHLEWLRGLTMAQQMEYRRRRGPNYLEPEPE